jgi:hypothetical protein
MPETALVREFFGKQGYVRVKFLKVRDPDTGRELIRIKGRKRAYRFRGETFGDLYAAQRYVADHIAVIDAGGVP